MDNLKLITLARQVKITRQYQKLYKLQKGIAKRTGLAEDFNAAARSLHISVVHEGVLDQMIEEVLIAGEEVPAE